eukprot:scaffold2729_cov188-Ochromonas_danica.AAC.6
MKKIICSPPLYLLLFIFLSSTVNSIYTHGGEKNSLTATSNFNPLPTICIDHQDVYEEEEDEVYLPSSHRAAFIIPSLLAADPGSLSREAALCASRLPGCRYLHVDICDGSILANRAFGLSPLAIPALLRACDSSTVSGQLVGLGGKKKRKRSILVDVHLIASGLVDGLILAPSSTSSTGPCLGKNIVQQLVSSGCGRITFQYEQLRVDYSLEEVHRLLHWVEQAGVEVGLCLAPYTPASELIDYLDQLASLEEEEEKEDRQVVMGRRRGRDRRKCPSYLYIVNVLAVLPGIGGQPFQMSILDSIAALRQAYPQLEISVDGGISTEKEAVLALEAGASSLVIGTGVFGRNRLAGINDDQVENSYKTMRALLVKHGH